METLLLQTLTPNRNRTLFVLGIETGLRVSELLSVQVSDVIAADDAVRRVLVVRKDNVKGKKRSQRVALSPTARDAIYDAVSEMATTGGAGRQRYLFAAKFKQRSITRRHAYAIISAALRGAGITHTTGTHTMRKTRASRVAAYALRMHIAGHTTTQPVMAVKAALGHASLRTTEKYLASGMEEVDAWTTDGKI